MQTYPASAVLMVAPTSFGFNDENATSNHFQHQPDLSKQAARQAAQAEFDSAVTTLRQAGITVTVHVGAGEPPKPDAVFPNNWFTTWSDGRVYIYPMAAANRRIERTSGVLEDLARQYDVREIIDFTEPEQTGRYLEATGAIVFDHADRLAYGCISNRCDADLLQQHARQLGYRAIPFQAYGHDGAPIYHTNVMMAVQSTTAIVCNDAIHDATQRQAINNTLRASGHELVEIDQRQLLAFCGNALELMNAAGERLLVLSQAAFDAFTPAQRDVLGRHTRLLPLAIPTIERVGGGSVRCMLAEVFLPHV